MAKSLSFERAFLAAYDRYADDLFRHCYYRVHDREVAKDLVQESFLRTWKYLREHGELENVRAFLYRVLNNLVIDAARVKRPSASVEQLQETGWEPAHDDHKYWGDRIDAQSVVATLQKIDEPYRTALQLRYIDGFSPKEIATVTGESANVISVRVNRAKKQLQQLLKR